MPEKIEVKEHAENMMKAIQALMPSRNYIVQFLAILPADFSTVYEAFPEFVKDEEKRKVFEKVFGVSFGERVELRDSNKLGSTITNFYREISEKLATNNDMYKGIAHLMEINENNVPDPMAEWLKLRLEGLAMEPNYGQDAMNVLRTVKKIGEEKNPKSPLYEASYNQIARAGNVDEHHIHHVIEIKV